MIKALHTRTYSQKIIALLCALSLFIISMGNVAAQTETITVQVDRPGAKIPETLFGLFFEDINFAADGGLYPERIKNRSFEFPDPMMGWKRIERENFKGVVNIINQNPVETANPRFMRIEPEAGGKGFGVANEGFRGIGVNKGEEYNFSVYARGMKGRDGKLARRT